MTALVIFSLEFGLGTEAQSFSMSSADYDQDGDLDVYRVRIQSFRRECPTGCNGRAHALSRCQQRWPEHAAEERGQLGISGRYHRKLDWTRTTRASALPPPGRTSTTTAIWICMWPTTTDETISTGMKADFQDVAAELGVEDMSAGMSASWADVQSRRLDGPLRNVICSPLPGIALPTNDQFKTDVDQETCVSNFSVMLAAIACSRIRATVFATSALLPA